MYTHRYRPLRALGTKNGIVPIGRTIGQNVQNVTNRINRDQGSRGLQGALGAPWEPLGVIGAPWECLGAPGGWGFPTVGRPGGPLGSPGAYSPISPLWGLISNFLHPRQHCKSASAVKVQREGAAALSPASAAEAIGKWNALPITYEFCFNQTVPNTTPPEGG